MYCLFSDNENVISERKEIYYVDDKCTKRTPLNNKFCFFLYYLLNLELKM